MLNLIKMNWYQMRKSTYFKVVLILGVISAAIDMYTVKANATQMGDFSICSGIAEMIQSCEMIVFMTILVSLFIRAEHKSGYVKNIAGRFKYRWMNAISKIMTASLVAGGFMVLYILLEIVLGKILCPNVAIGFSTDFISFVLIQYVLTVAFTALISMITILFQSTALSIIFGIFCAGGITFTIDGITNVIFHTAGFHLSNYTITSNVGKVGIGASASVIIQAILVACVWFLVSTAATMYVTSKRDTI